MHVCAYVYVCAWIFYNILYSFLHQMFEISIQRGHAFEYSKVNLFVLFFYHTLRFKLLIQTLSDRLEPTDLLSFIQHDLR